MSKRIIKYISERLKPKVFDPMTSHSDFYSYDPRAITLRRSHNRIFFGTFCFIILFLILIYKTYQITFSLDQTDRTQKIIHASYKRGEITDRNNVVIATQLKVANLVVNPSKIIDPDEAFEKILEAFPNLPPEKLEKILYAPQRKYAVLKRNITPLEQQKVHNFGLPGLFFETHDMRFYPQNNLASHVLGATDTDKNGVAGIEKYFDQDLKNPSKNKNSISLTLDIRVQDIMRSTLLQTIEKFNAIGGAGIVMHAETGEIMSLVSLPDFNPNTKRDPASAEAFNRATVGTYEMGSTFKILNTAIAFDTQVVSVDDQFDVSKKLRFGRYSIGDFHHIRDPLTAPEILQKSSNIGSVKIAEEFGPYVQKYYMSRFGMLKRPTIELPERGAPLIPSKWGRIQMATISFGHGLAVTPLQLVSAVASAINGGKYVAPTLLKRQHYQDIARPDDQTKLRKLVSLWKNSDMKSYFKAAPDYIPELRAPRHGERIISEEASLLTRYSMRLVCERGGSGTRADVTGYPVIGKTGTAEKHRTDKKGYSKSSLISSFIGAFPAQKPEYIIYVMIDEPKPNLEVSRYATGGIVAAPAVGKIIHHIGPLLNVEPTHPGDTPDYISNQVYNISY